MKFYRNRKVDTVYKISEHRMEQIFENIVFFDTVNLEIIEEKCSSYAYLRRTVTAIVRELQDVVIVWFVNFLLGPTCKFSSEV